MTTAAIASLLRGCGASRTAGGAYWECGLAPNGARIEEFLIDCPSLLPQGLPISPRGVATIEVGGVTHVVDWVGSEHYLNTADFVAECLPPGEHIATDVGLVALQDIREGDQVLTHRGRFRRVTSVMQRSYTGPLISIVTTYLNQPLRLTPEHPVYRAKVLRGRKRYVAEKAWGERIVDRSFVPAHQVEKGDYICYPIRREEKDVDAVTMVYVKEYRTVYANSLRTPALAERALTLRSPAVADLKQHHHVLLRRLSGQTIWSYAEIKGAAGDAYRFESGLARALGRLIDKGYVRRVERGLYEITAHGAQCAALPYRSYRQISRHLNVSIDLVYRLINPLDKTREVQRVVPCDVHLMTLAGYYLAEGSVNSHTGKRHSGALYLTEFSFGSKEKERGYALEVQEAARALGFHAAVTVKEGCYHVTISSRHLAHFLVEHFGRGAADKTIPTWVLGLPPAKVEALLRAYLNGDAYRRRERWEATTVSLQLAYSLAQAANKLGYRTAIARQGPSVTGIGKTSRERYRVTVYQGTGTDVFCDSEYLYLPVTSVTRLEYSGTVYNLAVEDDESYCTTYHTVHNCSRLGLSRRLPSTLDFGKITPASRILLIHARARIENASLYGPFACPKGFHDPGADACIGAWWQDVEGGVPVPAPRDPRLVRRSMPAFTYQAHRRPDGVAPRYVPGFFASFPASRIAVVKGGDGRALVAALKAGVPVAEVDA